MIFGWGLSPPSPVVEEGGRQEIMWVNVASARGERPGRLGVWLVGEGG